MTPILKELLHSYGLLYVTILTLQKERPRTTRSSTNDHYAGLGRAESGEPVLVVRISQDGESRIADLDAEHLPEKLRGQYADANLKLMELPEDEFYFFHAFRPGICELDKQLPPFILQMALVYSLALFENYIADVVRIRLNAHPAQVGLKKHVTVADVLSFATKEELLAGVIDNEVNQVMHLPIMAIIDSLRTRFGMRKLPNAHDKDLELLALTRNCFVHNAGKVDHKLATADPSFMLGGSITVDTETVSRSIDVCRKFCASVDRELELLDHGQGA